MRLDKDYYLRRLHIDPDAIIHQCSFRFGPHVTTAEMIDDMLSGHPKSLVISGDLICKDEEKHDDR